MPKPDRDPVREQYENWVYPPPLADLTGYTRKGLSDPSLLGLCYWPDRPPRDDLKVLVAGCGPNAAARLAFQNPHYHVLGIDLSEASLQHASRLKEKHGLDNLTLRQMRVEDAAKLKQTFDFIHCAGVLHHLPNPLAGLKALAKVLERDGVIFLMLYARYGRSGVYMMQELLRMLGARQSPEDVALARQAVAQSGKSHPIRLFEKSADLQYDTGVVDLLLHPVDRPYTVAECLELVGSAGLVFQGWEQNHLYYPEILLPSGSDLYRRINQLAEQEIWKASELLNGSLTMHSFYACHRKRDPSSYVVNFDDQHFMNWVAVPTDGVTLRVEQNTVSVEQPRVGKISFQGVQAALVKAFDGKRTVRDCAQGASTELCRDVCRVLWRLGLHHFVRAGAIRS